MYNHIIVLIVSTSVYTYAIIVDIICLGNLLSILHDIEYRDSSKERIVP